MCACIDNLVGIRSPDFLRMDVEVCLQHEQLFDDLQVLHLDHFDKYVLLVGIRPVFIRLPYRVEKVLVALHSTAEHFIVKLDLHLVMCQLEQLQNLPYGHVFYALLKSQLFELHLTFLLDKRHVCYNFEKGLDRVIGKLVLNLKHAKTANGLALVVKLYDLLIFVCSFI